MTEALDLSFVVYDTPIAPGSSLPTDPAAASFLTLPSEIRNAVYDLLFHVTGGVRVAPSTYCLTQGISYRNTVVRTFVEGLRLLSVRNVAFRIARVTR